MCSESFFYRQLGTWIERKRALMALNKVVVANTANVDGIMPPSSYKDEDVLFEEESVQNTDRSQLALCIENLVKIYPSPFLAGKAKHAVRGLTLGCRVGERLGFLGVNGAGKSTTLGVLTGDIAPTGK